MKPILFDKNETNFTTNGLGRLDCISCKVVEERNGMYELEAEIPITGLHASDIEMLSIIGVISHEGGNVQAFVVYKITKPINGRFMVYARHLSYRLSDIPCSPFNVAASPQAAANTLAGLKNNALEPCPFNFSTDVTTGNPYTQNVPASIRQRLGGVEGSVLDQFGGEFEFDNWNVKLWKSRGRLSNVTGISLRYGKNITDINQEEEIATTVTGVVPYWIDTDGNNLVTLPEHVIYSDNAANYPYHITQVLDLSSEFKDKPTVAQLRSTANAYVHKSGFGIPKVSIKVSFVDLWKSEEYKDIAPLERVQLCDEVSVYFEKLGISSIAKVVKTDFDVLKERYNNIEVGSLRTTLAQAVTDRDRDIDTAFINELTRVNGAISNATAWLTSANGYVVAVKNDDGSWKELFLMNTNDPQTATQGIRFNNNGLGFFNKALHPGGNILSGPYDMAWTIDGRLGDFVNKNFWNFITGEFSLSAGATVGGKTVDAIAQEKADAAELAAENTAAQALAAQVAIYDADIADLQNQIDGNVTTWYYSGAPTLNNLPASQWTTTTDKDNHIGDIYYDSATGYAYRFMKDGNNYVWTKISDSDIEAALAEAQDAWDLADNKRRVFISQPIPPYDVGDMWVQGSHGDIKRCATAKTKTQTYSASDWILASKYTDDTAVTNLNNSLDQQEVFNRLTDDGRTMGIYLTPDPSDPTKKLLMINASYIQAGDLSANRIKGGTLILGGTGTSWTKMNVEDSNGNYLGGIADAWYANELYVYGADNPNGWNEIPILNGNDGWRVIGVVNSSISRTIQYTYRPYVAGQMIDLYVNDIGYRIILEDGNGTEVYYYDVFGSSELKYRDNSSHTTPLSFAYCEAVNTAGELGPAYAGTSGEIYEIPKGFGDEPGEYIMLTLTINNQQTLYNAGVRRIRIKFSYYYYVVGIKADGIYGNHRGTFNGYANIYDSGANLFIDNANREIHIINTTTDRMDIAYDDITQTVSGTAKHPIWSASDERVKEDIAPLDVDLSKNLIDATKPKRFKFKNTDGVHYGVTAQDMRKILDNIGETDSELEHSMGLPEEKTGLDDERMVEYLEFIPHIINYIKDLQAQNNRQQTEIDELKGIVKKLSI